MTTTNPEFGATSPPADARASSMRRLAPAIVITVLLGTCAIAAPAMASTPRAATTARHCPLPRFHPGTTYHPVIRPRSFSARITNPWFPLSPGTTFIYSGHKDGKRALDIVEVSHSTRRIDGVRTRLLNDRLFLDGVLEERTTDYYAQDRCGNVWYFGEDTATLNRRGNVVDRGGSFHAGVDGAQPGVYMQRNPRLGRWFRQEWYRGQAEDRYRAVQRNACVSSRYTSSHHALRTEERTRLEPGTVDNKYYVRGIGTVREVTVRGGHEQARLVAVLH